MSSKLKKLDVRFGRSLAEVIFKLPASVRKFRDGIYGKYKARCAHVVF
jgi:hypothetical protein